MNKNILIVAVSMCWAMACSEQKPADTPTAGQVRIAVDETLMPLADALIRQFEHTYKNAHIEVAYLPESQVFRQLLNDSVQLVIAARQLAGQELEYFEQVKITPRTSLIANDAIALLVHPDNPDSNFTCEAALKIFKDEITEWKTLSGNNPAGPVNLVFDNQGSGTFTYVLGKSGSTSPPANSYALKTNEAVVEYVASHPNALGIIGYNWLSDYDDPLARKLRKQIKVVALSPCEGSGGQFYKPFADNLLQNNYPFSRQVFTISREARTGLATGFAAYSAGEIGQRIIKLAGILPAYKVENNIELKSEPFRVSQ